IPYRYGVTTNYISEGFDHGAIVWEPQDHLSTLENKALFTQGIYGELKYFCDCVLEERKPELGTLEFAYDVMRVYEAGLLSDGQRAELAAIEQGPMQQRRRASRPGRGAGVSACAGENVGRKPEREKRHGNTGVDDLRTRTWGNGPEPTTWRRRPGGDDQGAPTDRRLSPGRVLPAPLPQAKPSPLPRDRARPALLKSPPPRRRRPR